MMQEEGKNALPNPFLSAQFGVEVICFSFPTSSNQLHTGNFPLML